MNFLFFVHLDPSFIGLVLVGLGVTWMNYCLVAAPAISLPFVFMAKEEYRRSRLDKDETDQQPDKDRSFSIQGHEDEI